MKKTLLLLAFTFSSLFAIAQGGPPSGNWSGKRGSSITGKITGTLYDSTTQAPIEFATIVVKNARTQKEVDGTISEPDGKFKIQELPLGTYDIYISFLGFQPKVVKGVELAPKSPDTNLEDVFLVPEGYLLEEIEVKGEAAVFENRVDKIVYNADKDITSQNGDATDVLQRVPLVEVDIDGNVSMRGSSNLQILINGRPSSMFTGGNLAEALKALPADQIKSVEVITTPSAKYDGEGTAGIINIITKKKEIEGFTGSASISAGTRTNRASLNLNMAKGRFGLNTSLSGWFGVPRESSNEFFRVDTVASGLRVLDQNGSGKSNFYGPRLSVGAFYDINAYNAINTNISFRGFGRTNDQTTIARFEDPTQGISQYYIRDSRSSSLGSGFDWTTDYVRKFKKKEQELVAAFQVSGNYRPSENEFDQRDTFAAITELDIRNRNQNDGINLEYTGQLDYTHPFSPSIKMETGIKSIIRRIDSEYSSEIFDFDQDIFIPIPQQTDIFYYDQDVYAGYLSFNFKFGEKYALIAGTRYEHTLIGGEFRDTSTTFKNDYGNLLPSIILSRKIGQFSNLKLAYNQRIRRPSLRTVNPYVDLSDPRDISFGNPNLNPELTHQLELAFSTFIKRVVLNGAVFYRITTDEINPITTVNANGVSETTYENIGESSALGLNFFSSLTLWKIWTLRGGGSAYYQTNTGQIDGEDVTRSAWVYRFNLNSTFKLPKDFAIELFGFFNSPRQSIQGSRGAYSMFSAGIQKEFWNERASIGFSVSQPFSNTLSFPSDTRGPGFVQTSDYTVEVRSFNIDFRYRFGQLNMREKRRRSKINNDDVEGGNGGQGGFQ